MKKALSARLKRLEERLLPDDVGRMFIIIESLDGTVQHDDVTYPSATEALAALAPAPEDLVIHLQVCDMRRKPGAEL